MKDKATDQSLGALLWTAGGARLWARGLGDGAIALRIAHGRDRAGLPPGAVPALEGAAETGHGRIEARWNASKASLALLDGDGRTILSTPPGGIRAQAGGAAVDVLLPDGAEVLGLGAKMGPLGRRGRTYTFWNRDVYPHTPDADPMYASLPFALVLDGASAWGLALVWGGRSRWDVGHDRPDRMRLESIGGGMDIVALAGPSAADVMRRFHSIFGPAALPPLWALGYQQSHWGYGDAEGFLSVAREFRERGMPLDAMYMDLDYEDGRRPLLWDPERFPEPRAFVDALHALDVRIVPISNAGVNTEDPRYAEAEAAGALVRNRAGGIASGVLWSGDTAMTDYLSPNAATLWDRFYASILADGVDGIWNDMNEPSFIVPDGEDPRGPRTLDDDDVHRDRNDAPWRHAEAHNAYPLFMNRATYESLCARRPGRRPFVLSRAGYLGVGRYATLWTGDNASWWEHLRATIPTVVGLGLGGVPLGGVDIGGFNDEASPELFARWLALGSMMPLCRNHSSITSPRQEPYAYGPAVEKICRDHLRLRYALMPYLYAALYAAHTTGEPIWRPLGYAFPEDPTAMHIEDEVLVGPHLLVAPVVEPAKEARAVYLPQGRWYRLDGPEARAYDGPSYHLATAPLGVLPIYARGGGILAVDAQPADRVHPFQRLHILVVPGGSGELTLFEDDGGSDAYTRGMCRITHLVWSEEGGRGRLSLRRSGRWEGATLVLRALAGIEIAHARSGDTLLDRDLTLPAGDEVEVEVEFGHPASPPRHGGPVPIQGP